MIDPQKTALLIIDMQNGFIDESSSLCITGARATLPACAKALDCAREQGIRVYHVCRKYSTDGSDVESTRFEAWLTGGKPISEACTQKDSLDFPEIIAPNPEDHIVVKPRFSAFFDTELDTMLRDQGVTTVVLAGTTTPNCIRTTCYDALSLNYNVAIIEDCTSSRTPEVQKSNIEDMAHIGAQIIDVETFCSSGLDTLRDIVAEHHSKLEQS